MAASGSGWPGSGARGRRAAVRALLEARDLQGLRRWVRENRNPLRPLTSLMFNADELICRRAVEALGVAAAIMAEGSLEKVRKLIRRLLWMMNDESGSICWYAPEAVGEVLVNVPSLIDEYGPLLLAYLKEEPFQRGVHSAIARVAAKRPDLYEDDFDKLARSLDNADPAVRGYALMALKLIDARSATGKAQKLADDSANVSIYDFDRGVMADVSVACLAKDLLDSVL